jgi:OPA family sugar phosphate sensor protein UhpC-like MFS transporter
MCRHGRRPHTPAADLTLRLRLQGILGWIAYLGAANAGIPLSHVVSSAGWNGFFTTLLGACGVALLLLSTVANAQSYNQRVAARAASA